MKRGDSAPDSVNDETLDTKASNMPTSLRDYQKLYHNSLDNREDYWRIQARRLDWEKPYDTIVEENFDTPMIKWFKGGVLNAGLNAISLKENEANDKHIALTYLPAEGSLIEFTDDSLKAEAEKLANALLRSGLKKGDRAALYMPGRPETIIFMLASSLAGITYVPIPHHFTPEVTMEIISDCGASFLFITNGGPLYNKRVACIVNKTNDLTIVSAQKTSIETIVPLDEFINSNSNGEATSYGAYDSEHPLFILYANSAAGIPRGSVFATGGFLVQAATSYDNLISLSQNGEGNTHITCTLNLASAAGQSYGIWGPLLNGQGIILTENGENTSAVEFNQLLEKYPDSALLTTPRLLNGIKQANAGETLLNDKRFSSIICSGDVLYPRLVTFAGASLTKRPENVLNLWVQSETGTSVISTMKSGELNRSGSLGLPSPGISAAALNTIGLPCRPNESGQLVFTHSWPGMLRTIWGQADRFKELYFQRVPGYFATNDAVRVDNDGFYWFMGRLDDVVKVRGHSLATSEIESVILTNQNVSEAAVVSVPGTENDSLTAFISLSESDIVMNTNGKTEVLKNDLAELVRSRIGAFAVPGTFIFAEELPRTKTGKLVRRVLRRIASGNINQDEDLSHVANPDAVEALVRKKR